MKTRTETAMALFGGAAAVALTIGVGGVGVGPMGGTSTTAHPSSSVAPALPDAATPGSTGIHLATLTGCIAGANC